MVRFVIRFCPFRFRDRGSALVLTLVMVLLLSLQVAMISLIALKSLGEGGILPTLHYSAKQGARTAILRLSETLIDELRESSPDLLSLKYARGSLTGAPMTTGSTLQINNPDSGSLQDTPVQISAWIAERKGSLYKLAGRAQLGSVDITLYQWKNLQACHPNGQLLTLVTERNHPGAHGYLSAMAVAPDGRVVFGERESPGNLYTWEEKTGLSVLLTGAAYPASIGGVAVNADGRFVIAEETAPSRVWSWRAGEALTTVISNGQWAAGMEALLAAEDGSFYLGQYNNPGRIWRWHPSEGLSVLASGINQPGPRSLLVDLVQERVYFGNSVSPGGKYYMWAKATGTLSEVVSSGGRVGFESKDIAPDGRIFMGENRIPGNFYTWKDGVLQTIVASFGRVYYPNLQVSPHDGRVFFSDGTTARCFTWSATTGLTTIYSNRTCSTGIRPLPDGGAYLGGWTDRLALWKNNNLSVLVSGVSNIAVENMVLSSDGWLALGQYGDPGVFRMYHPTHGLTTLVSSAYRPGTMFTLAVAPDGRWVFGEPRDPGMFWSWKPGEALITIATDLRQPGGYFGVQSTPQGWFYFGERAASGNFYAWRGPSAVCE